MINHDAHGLKAYFHDCVMYEEDRIDKHGEPVNFVYAKLKADRVIYYNKYSRACLYAKNHDKDAKLAHEAIRLLSVFSDRFTEETYKQNVAYWTRLRDNHFKHAAKWREYAAWFKEKQEEH